MEKTAGDIPGCSLTKDYNEGHRKSMETRWIPTEVINDEAFRFHVSLQAMVKHLQEQGLDYCIQFDS